MQLDSPIYRKAFQRYLRSGVTVEVQLKAAMDVAGEILLRKAFKSSSLGQAAVSERISQLQDQFAAANREFPDKTPPDTTSLEAAYEQQHRELLDEFATKPENVMDADWKQQLEDSENFLNSRFQQQIDPILQPHYGVMSFIWTANSDNSCANCASHAGQTYPWSGGDQPPGCEHCQCTAEPYLDIPFDPPIEPVYPVESALLALSGGEAVAAIRGAVAFWQNSEAISDKFESVTKALEDYFGGAPETIVNKKGDPVMMRDGKKVRFDVKNDGHGYEPHFHIEELDPDGDWVDAGSQHAYPFKKE